MEARGEMAQGKAEISTIERNTAKSKEAGKDRCGVE